MKKRIIDFETLVEERFEDYFNKMSEEEQIELWNEYARHEDEPIVHQMDTFEEKYREWEILDVISNLDDYFEANDDYFWTDRYSDICSSDDATDAMDIDELKDWFARHYYDDENFLSYCSARYDEDEQLFIEEEDEE